MIFAIIGVLLIISLSLTIIRQVAGTRIETTIRYEAASPSGLAPLPELPVASAGVIEALTDTETEWVTYPGRTPSLRLKMRGQSMDGYRYILRKVAAAMGVADLSRMPPELVQPILELSRATAYVVDWEGVAYPNGEPAPYSARALVEMMEADGMLSTFVTDHSERLSPPLPVS